MRTKMIRAALASLVLLITLGIPALAAEPPIRLNSLGFLPDQEKLASIAAECSTFKVIKASDGSTVFTGKVFPAVLNRDTDEEISIADFSKVRQPGSYYLDVQGVGRSIEFKIGRDVYNFPFLTVTRAMYLFRCGMEVSGTFKGQTFAHGACHTNDAYMDYVGGGHTKKASTGGWHDAGDYNKYIVNASVTVGPMFQAWEHFGNRLRTIKLDIPESNNKIPDFLDEIKYETDWILTMQADDGSVYHKLSTTGFGGFIMPETEKTDRFFTPWSSTATADYVAMMAMASRIFKPYDAAYSAKCLKAAIKSYKFLLAHPEYHAADLKSFSTGAYQAPDEDDRLWAAAELWETTGGAAYLKDFETRARSLRNKVNLDWDWSDVGNMGVITYTLSKRTGKNPLVLASLKKELLETADTMVLNSLNHGYGRTLGSLYYWGVNGGIARSVQVLQAANRISPNPKYINASLEAIGHLFGRNWYGRSFVTGLGVNPAMNPHDRRSNGKKGITPWPGNLVGGAWPGARDWVDKQENYQTNEIAINWNGAIIYALAGFVDPSADFQE